MYELRVFIGDLATKCGSDQSYQFPQLSHISAVTSMNDSILWFAYILWKLIVSVCQVLQAVLDEFSLCRLEARLA